MHSIFGKTNPGITASSMVKNLADISKLIIILSCVTLSNGCSISYQWFVRNYTNKEVLITLKFETKEGDSLFIPLPIEEKVVPYNREILKINQLTNSKLKDSLQIVSINDYTYQVLLPPASTVDLTDIIPGRFAHRINVIAEFEQEGARYSINSISAFTPKHNDLKFAGGLLIRNLIYFDYGKTKKGTY